MYILAKFHFILVKYIVDILYGYENIDCAYEIYLIQCRQRRHLHRPQELKFRFCYLYFHFRLYNQNPLFNQKVMEIHFDGSVIDYSFYH